MTSDELAERFTKALSPGLVVEAQADHAGDSPFPRIETVMIHGGRRWARILEVRVDADVSNEIASLVERYQLLREGLDLGASTSTDAAARATAARRAVREGFDLEDRRSALQYVRALLPVDDGCTWTARVRIGNAFLNEETLHAEVWPDPLRVEIHVKRYAPDGSTFGGVVLLRREAPGKPSLAFADGAARARCDAAIRELFADVARSAQAKLN